MIKTIGIAGGIGSGKSFVCEIIQKIGFPVYNSDFESKKIVETDSEIKEALNTLFDFDLFRNGTLDKAFLAEQLFSSDEIRLNVNAIIHPKVRSYFDSWAEIQNTTLVFNEAAILFETGSYKSFDKMILVTAPLDLRIQRVMERDAVSKEEVERRISKQWTDAQKIPLADFVIENDGRPLLIQVEEMIDFLAKS